MAVLGGFLDHNCHGMLIYVKKQDFLCSMNGTYSVDIFIEKRYPSR